MPDQPNILLFISDQQRTDTLGCYGNDWIQSPHQDALADRSFVFENTYVTQPVCTPARGSLMTGLYPHSHGCMVNRTKLRDEIPSIAELLPDTYRKAMYGKWHLGDDSVRQHGFDEWISTEDDHRNMYSRPGLPFSSYYYWMKDEQGVEPMNNSATGETIFSPRGRSELGPEHQMATFVANHSERFIRENTEQPWLLVFSTFEPHPPFTGPYDGMYDPDDMPLGPTYRKTPEGHSLFNRARADRALSHMAEGGDIRDEDGGRKTRANYYGNVKIIDDAVGRLVKVLEETGQMENTVFAFTSDHGEMLGDHAMLGKRAFYEESARVPTIMSVPWLTQEQNRIGGVFGHADLISTLLEFAGVSTDSLPGRPCIDVLKGEADLNDHATFMEWNGLGDRNLGNDRINLIATVPWRCVVTGDRWKLNLCAGDQCELFDLNTDPFEETNLYDDPAHCDRVREMAAMIRYWQYETGDDVPLPVT